MTPALPFLLAAALCAAASAITAAVLVLRWAATEPRRNERTHR